MSGGRCASGQALAEELQSVVRYRSCCCSLSMRSSSSGTADQQPPCHLLPATVARNPARRLRAALQVPHKTNGVVPRRAASFLLHLFSTLRESVFTISRNKTGSTLT